MVLTNKLIYLVNVKTMRKIFKLCTFIGDQNKLSVIKTFDNCVISKADVWAIKLTTS